MNQNLRRILLCAALAGLSFIHTKAYDWVPVGNSVDADGFALLFGSYVSGDYIGADAPIDFRNRPSATANPPFYTILNVYGNLYSNNPSLGGFQTGGQCSLKVNGNVVLDATFADMTINIQEDVVFEPYFNPPVAGVESLVLPEAPCSQLYFKTAFGTKITINVDHNLEFRGKTDGDEFKDLIVTFAGRGTTIFNMADGTTIKFNGQIDTSSPQVLLDCETGLFSTCPIPSSNAGGCKVFVLMDQTLDDVNSGREKVRFQRQNIQGSDFDTNQRVLIEVGPNSVFTYLSTNPTGEASELFSDGYAVVQCDVSNGAFQSGPNGRGRMIWFIRGAYLIDTDPFLPSEGEDTIPNPCFGKKIEKYLFNDGALLINGHFVEDFEPATISGCTLATESEEAFPGYDFSKPAGIKAIFRVCDTLHLQEGIDGSGVEGNPYNPQIENRRGLLVVNENMTASKYFSDPYWDLYTDPALGFIGVEFAQSNPVNALFNTRRGVVLGVNGQLDVYHNTFFDHVSGTINVCDPLAECDFGLPENGGTEGIIKKRNPSAFAIDGLDTALFINGNPFILDFEDNPTASQFIAANPYVRNHISRAEILLRGTGTVYVRESAASDLGYLYKLFSPSEAIDPDPLNNTFLDWTNALAVGNGTYDGYKLSPNEHTKQSGEGEHVLDVEGLLDVASIVNTAVNPDGSTRVYSSLITNSGVFNAASILIDYTGREVLFGDDSLISRPLDLGITNYARYNSPTLFFNNFAQFTGSILRHSDVTKCVDCIPNISEPGMTGGERLWFGRTFWGDTDDNHVSDPNRFRFPELQLYNSILELQESLNFSGFRLVVKDIPDVDLGQSGDTEVGRDGDNTSVIKFFDHGDFHDTCLTGHGRILLVGSRLNVMCDDINNCITDSAFINVFKHNKPTLFDSLNNSSRPTLSLQNGDQFSPEVQAAIDAVGPTLIDKQRAHHLICIAQPQPFGVDKLCVPCQTVTDCQASANIVIGWGDTATINDELAGNNSPAGDSGAFPGSFPYPFPHEPLIPPTVLDPFQDPIFIPDPFTLDALRVPVATLSIDGSIMCFASFDKNGKSIPVPVLTDNDNGIVYVKHGGKITITRPPFIPIPGTGERLSIPNQCVFSTMLAQRVWNDYNFDGNTRVVRLTGIVDLPHDEVTFDESFGVQPYNFTATMFDARRFQTDGLVRLSFENEERPRRLALGNDSGAEEVTIGWRFRDCPDLNTDFIGLFGTAGNILPKSLKHKAISDTLKWLTRATESVNTPVDRPTDLLYIGPGDDIVQMKVAGATMSDPFALEISGDGVRPTNARVREFVSLKSTNCVAADRFISEGAHAVLFLDFNGRIGLGSRAWNELSVNAWNLLGKDYVTICPLGDGCVDLNSNLLITDRLALIAGSTFGSTKVDRLTFYSQEPREIRIPAGGELDLSSFGQTGFRQEIAFAGQARLVIEEGATIRFPAVARGSEGVSADGVVLYGNDTSNIVFEGSCGSSFLPFTDAVMSPNSDLNNAPIEEARIRLLGNGQIWLNKFASMIVNGNVFVGVETDPLTPQTDIIVSIQREGTWYIGDENVPGGTFQVGNPTNFNTEEQTHTINFALLMNGPNALFHIDREGFFGFGAGIKNKDGAPNGDASPTNNPVLDPDGFAAIVARPGDGVLVPVFNPAFDASTGVWQVQALNNVNVIRVELTEGIIEHRNIFDGTTNNSSLWALGPAQNYFFALSNNNDGGAFVRGGGNMMLVPESATENAPIFVNIWDYAGPLVNFEQYSILASGPLLLDRALDVPSTSFGIGGHSYNFVPLFGASPEGQLFNLLAFLPLKDQPLPKIDLSETKLARTGGFTNNTANRYNNADNRVIISRVDNPSVIEQGKATIEDAVELGALTATTDADGNPTTFTVVQ